MARRTLQEVTAGLHELRNIRRKIKPIVERVDASLITGKAAANLEKVLNGLDSAIRCQANDIASRTPVAITAMMEAPKDG